MCQLFKYLLWKDTVAPIHTDSSILEGELKNKGMRYDRVVYERQSIGHSLRNYALSGKSEDFLPCIYTWTRKFALECSLLQNEERCVLI